MTITIDVSLEEAERLARQARLAGEDLPSFVRHVLERASGDDDPMALAEKGDTETDSFFGIWSGRRDLTDSEKWVTKERATWQSRPGRPA